MERKLVLQLNPTTEQAATLKRTLDAHTACFNEVARVGFTSQCRNGIALHKETYYPLRAQYPDLPSQLVCAARVKATEAVTSALTWKRKKERDYPKKVANAQKQGRSIPRFKPVKCPSSISVPIRYDQRSYWIKWNQNICSLASVAGRIELPFTVPHHLEQYVGNKTCSADLCYRKGWFILHVVVSIPEPKVAPNALVITCRHCGYSLNADLNAAYNIREKHLSSLASVGTPSLVGSPVKLPIVSTACSEGQAPSPLERGP